MVRRLFRWFLVIFLVVFLYSIYSFSNDDKFDNTCGCPRPLKPILQDLSDSLLHGNTPPDGSYVGESSCNKYTSHLGSGQNVLSYSFYSAVTRSHLSDEVTGKAHWRRYLELLPDILHNMTRDYPGWRLRMYHNLTQDLDQLGFLCDLYCKNPHMDMCDMRQVPELVSHIDLEGFIDLGRAWRFAVLGDPTVRMFGVRDLDMFILGRELAAVQEWMGDDSKQFYVMRDTPARKNRAGYRMPIKGGFWGGDNYADFEFASSLRMNDTRTRAILTPEVWEPYGWYFNLYFDMVYLRHLVWFFIRERSRNYEAYNCKFTEELGESVPWPTRREGRYYVGIGPIRYKERMREEGWKARWTCPEQCRPEGHKDWQFC